MSHSQTQLKHTSSQQPDSPNWAVLIFLWLFAATLGLFVGYLPPRFKPRWLYKLVQGSIFTVWIGLGVAQLMYLQVYGEGPAGVVMGLLAILVGVGGLVFVFQQTDDGGGQTGRRVVVKP